MLADVATVPGSWRSLRPRLLVVILAAWVPTIGHARSIEVHQLTRPDGSEIQYYLVHPDDPVSPLQPMLVLLHG